VAGEGNRYTRPSPAWLGIPRWVGKTGYRPSRRTRLRRRDSHLGMAEGDRLRLLEQHFGRHRVL